MVIYISGEKMGVKARMIGWAIGGTFLMFAMYQLMRLAAYYSNWRL